MTSDAQYDLLNVKRTLYANHIETNTITLNDTTLRGNIHTSGKRVKELYEAQENTNCYTDEHHKTVEKLQSLVKSNDSMITVNPCFFKLHSHHEINDVTMPDKSYCMCLDDNNNVIYKIKTNNTISYGQLTSIEPHINIKIQHHANSNCDLVMDLSTTQ